MRQADVDFVVRTDLAIEERERVWESGSEIAGVRMREWEAADAGIRVTEVLVCDERGEEALGKPVGVYLTLDAPSLAKKERITTGRFRRSYRGFCGGCLWIMGLRRSGWSGR